MLDKCTDGNIKIREELWVRYAVTPPAFPLYLHSPLLFLENTTNSLIFKINGRPSGELFARPLPLIVPLLFSRREAKNPDPVYSLPAPFDVPKGVVFGFQNSSGRISVSQVWPLTDV